MRTHSSRRNFRAGLILLALAAAVGTGRGLVACSDTAGGDSTPTSSPPKGNGGGGSKDGPAPSTVVQVPFTDDGSGPGRTYDPRNPPAHDPAEGNLGAAIGPSAFVVDDAGTVFLLDQVNSRIAKLGDQGALIPIPAKTYLDLAFDGNGGFILLQSAVVGDVVDRSVVFVDGSGNQTSKVEIPNLDPDDAPTALLVHDDGVWVELNHSTTIKVTDASFAADTSGARVDGRFMPSEDSVVMAGIGDVQSVLVAKEPVAGGDIENFPMVDFDRPVIGVIGLEADVQGNIYVAAVTGDPDDLTGDVQAWVVALDADGDEQWRSEFPPPDLMLDVVRPMRLGDDGNVYVMRSSGDGNLEVQMVQP